MLAFPTLTLSATGFSSIIQPYGSNGVQFGQNNGNNITSLGITVVLTSGASLTYSVQITTDPAPSNTGNWLDHDVLTGLTASKASNILYGVSGLRLHVTAYTSGSATLGVVQWP